MQAIEMSTLYRNKKIETVAHVEKNPRDPPVISITSCPLKNSILNKGVILTHASITHNNFFFFIWGLYCLINEPMKKKSNGNAASYQYPGAKCIPYRFSKSGKDVRKLNINIPIIFSFFVSIALYK
jgi:hypothetical protein